MDRVQVKHIFFQRGIFRNKNGCVCLCNTCKCTNEIFIKFNIPSNKTSNNESRPIVEVTFSLLASHDPVHRLMGVYQIKLKINI